MQGPSHSFTVTSTGGTLRVLKTSCSICPGHSQPAAGTVGPSHPYVEFQAIWDTGATGTVITAAAAAACGLKPVGMTTVHGVGGVMTCYQYLINLVLPNKVQFPNVMVTEGILPGGAGGDILIGMDVIGVGDFAITNLSGLTVFSFRVPSARKIDFVIEHNERLQREQLKAVHGGSKSSKKPKKTFGRNK